MIGTEQYTDKYIMERMEIMSKVAVVYWSGTGNTAAMATAVAEGAQENGCEAGRIPADRTATGVIFRGLPLSGLRRDVTLRC